MAMSGYTKLFNSILASTIWRESHTTRIVWITLLAMADKHGVAEGSVPGLADFARVSVPECRKALAALMAPDEDSRSREHDGRRIVAVDGGWQLLNHAKYRQKMGADERREYLRQKQAEYRKRRSTNVNKVSDTDTLSTHADAEAYTAPKAQDAAKGAVSVRAERQKYGRPLIGSPLEHRSHGWCNQRGLCLPASLYAELLGRLGGPEREKDLIAWLGATIDALETVPGETVWVFWRSRFEAWQGSTAPQKGHKPAKQPTYDSDWFDECKRLHANECGGQMKHAIRMQVEADA